MPRMDKLSTYKTTVSRAAGVTRVTYHETDIVTFSDTEITLNDGGWDTATTRRKMTQAARQFGLPYSVFRKSGVTMVTWASRDPAPLNSRAYFYFG